MWMSEDAAAARSEATSSVLPSMPAKSLAAQRLAAGEAAEAAGSKAGEDADAAASAGACALEAAACGALAACPAALAATSAAFAAFAAAINSRCRALTHSSTMRRAVLTLSSIDLVAICTISVSPLTSSSRTAPVVDSTGLIRRSPTQPLAVLWRRRREVTLRSVPGALFESRARITSTRGVHENMAMRAHLHAGVLGNRTCAWAGQGGGPAEFSRVAGADPVRQEGYRHQLDGP